MPMFWITAMRPLVMRRDCSSRQCHKPRSCRTQQGVQFGQSRLNPDGNVVRSFDIRLVAAAVIRSARSASGANGIAHRALLILVPCCRARRQRHPWVLVHAPGVQPGLAVWSIRCSP